MLQEEFQVLDAKVGYPDLSRSIDDSSPDSLALISDQLFHLTPGLLNSGRFAKGDGLAFGVLSLGPVDELNQL